MALYSELPRSRVSYQTLLDLSADSYVAHVISSIENEVFPDDCDCWNRAIQLAKSVSKMPSIVFIFQFLVFLASFLHVSKSYTGKTFHRQSQHFYTETYPFGTVHT
jgi:hypothetical protein